MEVVDENAGMISNFEVLELLQDIQAGQAGHRKPGKSQQHLATILYSTLKYLEKTPCKDQNNQIIEQFITAVSSFKLTKAEKLQLINQRPTTAVEIQLIVEESEERLTEEQIEELLNIVTTTLPGDPPAVEEEPMEEEEETAEAPNCLTDTESRHFKGDLSASAVRDLYVSLTWMFYQDLRKGFIKRN